MENFDHHQLDKLTISWKVCDKSYEKLVYLQSRNKFKFDELLEVEQHLDQLARGRDTVKSVKVVAKIEVFFVRSKVGAYHVVWKSGKHGGALCWGEISEKLGRWSRCRCRATQSRALCRWTRCRGLWRGHWSSRCRPCIVNCQAVFDRTHNFPVTPLQNQF